MSKEIVIAKIELGIAIFFAVAATVVLSFLIICSLDSFGKISDLPEYYASSSLVLSGHGADSYIYDLLGKAENALFPSLDGRVVILYIPPQGLTVFSLLSLVDVNIAQGIWKFVLVVCLFASVFILKRIFELELKQTCYLLAGICFSHAAFEAFRIDQLATVLLLLFCLTLYFLHKKKFSLAGLFLCLLFVLKPQHSIPFIVFLAGAKRWRVLPTFIIALTLLTVVAFFQIGMEGFINYIDLLRDPMSAVRQQAELSATVRGQMVRLFPDFEKVIFFVTTGIYGLLVLFSFVWGRVVAEKEDWLWTGIFVLIPLTLVLTVYCHTYDLLLITPAIILLFKDKVIETPSAFKLACIAGGLVFMLPISAIIHYEYLLKDGVINPSFILLSLFNIAILLFVWKNYRETRDLSKSG